MILVTGGAGFIGHHLVKALVDNGERVRVLDNASRNGLAKAKEKLPDGVELRWRDVRDLDAVEDALVDDNADCVVSEVIHLAAINGTERFYREPGLVLDVAVRGMLSVLDACYSQKVKRLTLFSSSEVCRAKLDMPDEAIPLVIPDPFNPRYSYSAGKIISEMLAIHSADQFERLLIVRPFNIYGPGMSEGHVIPDFMKKLRTLSQPEFEILGSGDETRSFCYIDDFIKGFMLMREKGTHMGIYNIGTPVETTIAELALKMARIVGRKNISIKGFDQMREGDALRRKPDISKLAALGYKPEISLDEGLRRMIA